MAFGLTGGSRERFEQLAGSADSAPVAARESSAPPYLPLAGERAAAMGLRRCLEPWLPQEAEGMKDLADLSVENPAESAGPRACVLIARTIHHREQMGLLCRARRRLGDGGRLIVAGEFLRDVGEIMPSDLPTEFSLRQLAGRLGFKLIEQMDWTAGARRSLATARARIAGQSAAESSGSRFPPAAWLRSLWIGLKSEDDRASTDASARLEWELASLAADFEAGHRRFGCFVFALDTAAGGPWSGLELGDIASFEPEEVAGVFEESFNTPFDAALWRWKYGEGKGSCIVARERPGEEIIAHYGGVARQIDYFGEERLAFQGCDVMVKPAVRRQYGRNSLYFHLTATLFEREIGYTADHVLGFGFPNRPVMKMAVRLGLYGKVDDYVELGFADAGPSTGELRIEPLRPESADPLWALMRQDFRDGVVGKRDADYLRYRYFSHPGAERYFPLLLSKGRDPFAVAVLKHHEEQWLLMDLVAPLARMDAAAGALAAWAEARPESGALAMWLTRAWVERLGWRGRIVKNLGIEIPFNAWNPAPDQTLPLGAWWLTAGDMDFI